MRVPLALAPLATAPLLLAPAGSPAAGPQEVSAGEPLPDLAFRWVLGGDGRRQLSEFRGQPVLIAHWTRGGFAPLDAVRVALDLEEKHADDGLVAFLMLHTDRDPTYLRAVQMDMVPGASTRLLLEQELHAVYVENGFVPRIVLIGVDGTLRYAGSYQGSAELKKLLKAELEKREDGWGASEAAVEARALAYGKGKLGAARAGIGDEPEDPELAALAGELEVRFDALERSVGFLRERGRPAEAREAAKALVEAGGGHESWTERAREVVEWLDDEAFREELGQERDLVRLLKATMSKPPRKGFDERLRKLAEDAGGSPVGQRAGRLADAVELVLGGLD